MPQDYPRYTILGLEALQFVYVSRAFYDERYHDAKSLASIIGTRASRRIKSKSRTCEDLIEEHRKTNPLLITDLARRS